VSVGGERRGADLFEHEIFFGGTSRHLDLLQDSSHCTRLAEGGLSPAIPCVTVGKMTPSLTTIKGSQGWWLRERGVHEVAQI